MLIPIIWETVLNGSGLKEMSHVHQTTILALLKRASMLIALKNMSTLLSLLMTNLWPISMEFKSDPGTHA